MGVVDDKVSLVHGFADRLSPATKEKYHIYISGVNSYCGRLVI